MTTLRSFVDPDQNFSTGPTSFMTERNEHEVRCGMCSRLMYVDESAFEYASDALKSGLDNPFRCEICEEEYDELAYEG